MADFGLAAQIGRGGGGGGTATPPDPMNRFTQLMQLQQMQQNMMLAREQAGRQQQLFAPQLRAAQAAAETSELELGTKRLDKETSDKLWNVYQTEDDPYNPEIARRLRKTEPRVAAELEKLASARSKAAADALKSRIDADKSRFELNKNLADFLVSIEPNVVDQQSYSMARRRFLENNPDQMSMFPEEYTPENKARLFSTLNRLRAFQVIRTPEGDDIVYDPINKTRRLLTEEGPVEVPSAGGAGGPAAGGPAAPAAGARAAAPSSAADMTANMLRRFEGFVERPYWDVNAYRTGYGSDTITRADGTVERVTPETTITREDAERDLQRRINTEFLPRAVQAVGQESWAALPPTTQAALTSITYNYGRLPSAVAQAAKTGNPNLIASAVEALAPANEGVNANRRIQEAAIIRGTGLLPGGQAVPSMTMAPTVNIPGSAPMGANALAPMAMPPVNAMVAPPQPAALAPSPELAAAAPAATVGLTPAQQRKVAAERATVAAREEEQARVKRQEKETERGAGQTRVGQTLTKMAEAYDALSAAGGIPDERKTDPQNISAYLGSTDIGQVAGKALATRAQTQRNRLLSLTRTLISDMKNATGMSAQELNNIKELELMLAAASNPTQSIQSVYQILNDLNERYGSGKRIEFKSLAETAETPPSSGIPRGRRGAEPAAAPERQPQRTLIGKDKEALDWANANPNDPRAAAIKQRLGVQ